MASLSAIPEPDRSGLRSFGFLFASLLAAIFGLVVPWIAGRPFPLWPWLAAVTFAAVAAAAPHALRPFFRLWMRFGLLMSRIVTPLMLAIVFFGVITPIALVRRLIGKDSLARRLEPDRESYRVLRERSSDDSMERPF